MKVDLSNKVAIITGATGGIGQAVVREFAASGASIVLGYASNRAKADELLKQLVGEGAKVIACQADLSSGIGASHLVKSAVDHFGNLDILVNNAGITRDGLFLRMKESDWDMVVDTNLKSAFLCAQAASRYLMRSPAGRIINMSSIAGIIGNAGQANYVAAKAGMIGLTKTLARELASRSVTVNAIAPGFIETEMTAALSQEISDKMHEQIPLRRFGQPEDVASLCTFLASDHASYISGQVLQVDGGLVM
jgi:3-oxoacyl-[acyl-carrier protein] reductase